MPSHQDRVWRNYIDGRVFACPSCPFRGGEDAMIEHAQAVGHIALPVERRVRDRRVEEDEMSRMADEGCPNA